MKTASTLRRSSFVRRHTKLRLESLDGRSLPSISSPTSMFEVEPNNVLGQSLDLGTLSNQSLIAEGTIGDGVRISSDVDWYSFTLEEASNVVLTASDTLTGDRFGGIITLYTNDPFSFSDPATAAGVRLLTQTVPSNGNGALFERALPAGTYYFALSAVGNPDFHPYLSDSGLPGPAGNYQVAVTSTSLKLDSTAGPHVISSEPASNAELSASPLVVRVRLSAPLDPNSVIADSSVTLFHNASGDFKADPGIQISAAWANFSIQAGELQFAPISALEPGFYHFVLHGNSPSQSILTDVQGVPFGSDASHPNGQDFEFTFRVTAIENGFAPNDSATTAYPLGNLVDAGSIRIAGVIGDDPTQNPNDPVQPTSPGADVDLYYFQVSGPGVYQLTAEVFAGRIGSRLDPGVSLFRLNPKDGLLHLVTANEDTQDSVSSTNGMVPLYTDPVLYAGLTAGDYYLAVSARNNTPDPILGLAPGKDGVFDPNISHSAMNGASVGDYVLSANVQLADAPPEVISTSLQEASQLESAPTGFDVEFSSVVNLRKISFASFNQPTPGELSSVYVLGSNGAVYYPRLTDFDPETSIASFLMLDRLPEGDYELHLSGSSGLKDLADQELIGNDPSGDFVVHFQVLAIQPGVGGNPLIRLNQEPNNKEAPQDLGTLFPRELQTGIEVTRNSSNTVDTSDIFRFEVLQAKPYVFNLDQTGLKMQLLDESGNTVDATLRDTGDSLQADLEAGVYFLQIDGWTEAESQNLAYRLRMVLGTSSDNPPPLTIGPRPASMTNLVGYQNSLQGENPRKPSSQEPVSVPDSSQQGDRPLSVDAEKIDKNPPAIKSTESVTKSEKSALTGIPSTVADTKFNATIANSTSPNSLEVVEGCGPTFLAETASPAHYPFVAKMDDHSGDWRASPAMASTQISPLKSSDRIALPATLLSQLRADPIGGIQIEEETSGFVSTSESSSLRNENANDTQGMIQTTLLEAKSSGWIRNISSAMMLILVGGTGMSRHILRRRTRTLAAANLLRSPELIQIGR